MSLNSDLSKVKDWKELNTPEEYPRTEVLIFYTMFTDIGWEITEENAPEFYARIKMMEKLDGTLLNGKDTETGEIKPVPITPANVKRIIGLKVNVAPMTRLQWVKKLTKRRMEELAKEYKEAKDE